MYSRQLERNQLAHLQMSQLSRPCNPAEALALRPFTPVRVPVAHNRQLAVAVPLAGAPALRSSASPVNLVHRSQPLNSGLNTRIFEILDRGNVI